MKQYRLDDMVKGWFIGSFEPTAFSTTDCEVAFKMYKMGDREDEHYHRIATEITLVVSGVVLMCERRLSNGDIIVLSPGDSTSFEALTDVSTVVVKIPGALNDKYLTNNVTSYL